MRVAVMAAGAVGSYFGGRLAEAGHEVHFIARGAHLEAIKKNGLKVESPLGDIHIKPAKVTDDPKQIGPVDVVLFAVKLWDTEKAGEQTKPLVSAQTRVLTMLNGVDSVERLTPILGDVVCATPTRISAVIKGPGVIAHKGNFANLTTGFLDGRDDARLKGLVDEMKAAKVEAEFSRGIEKIWWEKFVFLASFSAITASTRSTAGPIMADPDTRELFRKLLEEVEAVGIQKGVPLQGVADKSFEFAKTTAANAPALRASMAEDVERGNRLETEWLQGKVAALGKELGVPTPSHAAIYATLKLLRNGKAM
jgi:2-dehydropantoate 2-reductase